MTEHADEPQTSSDASDGDELTDEQRARQTRSPAVGYPAGTTDPQGGLRGDEGRVNAEATPTIADDAKTGQTATPAPAEDASEPSDA